ncbi:hypothetical protein M218_23140 [Burkholderia pseudomallei MSHR338]|nr:hypothetical protein M218_23140 [Burkholderia pseudomallei MSHR338]KEO65791.1 hypothetical protein J103_31975 [Burkholderia pseudomallei MSHR5855]
MRCASACRRPCCFLQPGEYPGCREKAAIQLREIAPVELGGGRRGTEAFRDRFDCGAQFAQTIAAGRVIQQRTDFVEVLCKRF